MGYAGEIGKPSVIQGPGHRKREGLSPGKEYGWQGWLLASFNYDKVISFLILQVLHVSLCPLAAMKVQEHVGTEIQTYASERRFGSFPQRAAVRHPVAVTPSEQDDEQSELPGWLTIRSDLNRGTLPESRDWQAVDQTANNDRRGLAPSTSTKGTQSTRDCNPPIEWEMSRAMVRTGGIIREATPMGLPSDSFTQGSVGLDPRRPNTV